ncbi:uroporphyrinogen-III synthase [Penicillium ochrochloron]
MSSPPPILLLKTKSSPHDGYEDYFSTNGYKPTFIPVLEHRFHTENLATVREFFASGAFNAETTTTTSTTTHHHGNNEDSGCDKKYGGMIFTSQRAVEAFAEMIEEKGLPFTPSKQPPPLPLYTVGPATARALTTLRNKYLPTATIHGADAGNGQNLAYLMLEHYNGLYPDTDNTTSTTKPSLLFLVGEQRRDIIPKTLMDPARPKSKQINVDEIVVYETGEMDSFEKHFRDVVSKELQRKVEGEQGPLWVVVFSPTGCEGMLRVLGMGPFKNQDQEPGQGVDDKQRDVFIATIGPTTRDYLKETFGFEADVCAEKPSPEGIAEGIKRFMDVRGD